MAPWAARGQAEVPVSARDPSQAALRAGACPVRPQLRGEQNLRRACRCGGSNSRSVLRARALRFTHTHTHTLCHLQGPPFLARKVAFLSELHPLGLLPDAVYWGRPRPLHGEVRRDVEAQPAAGRGWGG